ncbi:FAD-binding oxidoreductase [Terracidiphilus gabretensis]|uniref:FAD-binding oxidoreductase n=1 Tax=Terracidiphilus gabretensis TaxID=1577687 RepID=UPI00071BB8E0|nr:FAD-binding oxidoreductase [Terracidiphilus gabretensis]
MSEQLASDLRQLVADPARVITAPAVLDRLSHDFYWYSPILRPQLADKQGDIAVQPVSVEEVLAILRFAGQHEISVTTRGAGTGNYGQCVPLHGGIILDLSLMDKLESITEDGVAVCQPGLRLGALETEARARGWELRMYPSTLVKASIGGFLGGGSGGIGSVAHGGLRDFDTVRAFEVVTMEDEPRVVLHEGATVHEILHAWGTNGILTRIWFALTPAVAWTQVTIAFDDYDRAFDFAESIAGGAEWTKRLVTVFEWPIPSFFTPVKQVVRQGKALVLLMIATDQLTLLHGAAQSAGGEVTFTGPYDGPRTQPLLSDYTWNHTTLWAMKADPAWTYLQCGFSPTGCREQFHKLRERFGEEFLFHIEFMKNGEGVVIPGAIPVVRFTTPERLQEMIDYCRAIGVFVANPHVNYLEDGGRFRPDNIQLRAKQKYDPRGLLNPGKMISFHKESLEVETAK